MSDLSLRDRRGFQRKTRRRPNITTVVAQSVEAIDFDTWAERFVLAVIEADRLERQLPEAA